MSEQDVRKFRMYTFEYVVPDGKRTEKNTHYRMLVFANPDLVPILRRRGVPLFIDATFRCVPHPFKQCLVVMGFDDETELYVPVLHILMENSSHWSYWHALHLAVVASGCRLSPSSITVDFESALISACREQFPEARLNGCLFHFKQAVRRRLVKLAISADEISRAMQPECLDVLTLTSWEHIEQAIIALRERIGETDSSKWDEFYYYFRATWLKKIPFDVWNISSAKEMNVDIVNRTNNALECYNRVLGEKFSAAHPNVFSFIDTIREMSKLLVAKLSDKRRCA